MHTSDILTARLRLIAITPEFLHAQEHAPHTLGTLLNAHVPPGWPTAEWEPHVYAFLRNQWQAHPHTLEWHRYILLPGDPDTLIGGIGAHPKSATEAEIGYGVIDAWQRHGYATEAARALIQHLFREGQQRVRAQTFPHLTASLRVMEKLGMGPAGMGDEEGAVCYAVERKEYA